MSGGLFGGSDTPKVPKQEVAESVTTVVEDAAEEQQREKRRIRLTQGFSSTMMAGIVNALKRRLGE